MPHGEQPPEDSQQGGLRERKRRDTLQRIAQTGLDLFIAKGYEETTLDDIAAAAGISRRTFFHYVSLRMVAMVGLGAFRVAIDEWIGEGGKMPLTRRIEKTFASLRVELAGGQGAAG